MILLQTRELLVVNKPAGLLVHNSAYAGPRERTLVDDVRDLCGPGWHPIHRLDRQTSGAIAFARDASRWTITEKKYWALVRGHVKDEVRIDHPIVDDGLAREASSIVRPLQSSDVDRCSLVEIELLTGRKHQARRHLKHIAHPIIGDATHGKGALNREYREKYGLTRMALHARSLKVDGRRVVAPLPDSLEELFARLHVGGGGTPALR